MNAAPQPVPVPDDEIYVIPTDDPAEPDSYLVYAPLRRCAFVAHAEVVNFLAELRAGRHDRGFDADGRLLGWLRTLGLVDAPPAPRPSSRPAGEPRPTGVTLFLTTGCNLRCTYCYASAGDTPLRNMPIEVARRGIDFVSDNARRLGEPAFQLAFHGGGEPTLNWAVLTGAFAYARERARRLGLALSASTATNGVLADARVDWIVEHLDSASLSFDGDPAAQDLHRPTVGGKGSSARVLRTIGRFDRADFAYGIRMTVTRDQIARLPGSVAFVCENASPRAIQVEPAYRMGRWRDAPSAETGEFIEKFREAREIARGYGHELVYSAARVGLLTDHFCGVSQDGFALTPDGNVSACYEVFAEDNRYADTFLYAAPDLAGAYRFDMERVERLRDLSVDHKAFCDGCYARWHCAGDCHHNAIAGGGEFAGSDRCHITRALTRDQVMARIAAAGGLAWCDGPESVSASSPSCS